MAKRKNIQRRRKPVIKKQLRQLTPGRLLISKTYSIGDAYGNATTGIGSGAALFQINYVPDLVSLCSLFDQYRINGAQIKLVPVANSANVGVSSTLGRMFSYVDYTDATPPTSFQEVLDRKDAKIHRCDQMWTEYVAKPRVADMLYKTPTTTGYGVGKPQFITCDNLDIPHYGWKYYLDNAQNNTIRVFIRLYVEFKDPR